MITQPLSCNLVTYRSAHNICARFRESIDSALTAEYVDDVAAVVHGHEGDLRVVAATLSLVVKRYGNRTLDCEE